MLDSNLIILAARPDYPGLRRYIGRQPAVVSAITTVEVLGFHRITEPDRLELEAFFDAAEILPISDAIIWGAVALRQAKKMSLGDAIIAATALEFGLDLYTHNTADFAGISGLTVIDPLANGDPV